jgi:hypothetical protein
MTRSDETYLNWVNGGYFMSSRTYYFMAKTMIEELGPEKGKELFLKQIYKMGNHMGKQNRKYVTSQGKENNIEEWFGPSLSELSVYSFAWEQTKREVSRDEAGVEWSVCPIAEGFKKLGSEGIEIGEWFCDNIDNASVQGYNPKYECVRESSLHKDGVCRLHFKLKE